MNKKTKRIFKSKRILKKTNPLAENYRLSLDYIRESNKFIYLIIVIFVVFAVAGFLFPIPEPLLSSILELIKQILEKTQGLGTLDLGIFIFLNNLQSSFLGMILGVAFGIYPLIVSAINGYVLGFVASVSVSEESVFILWRLLPHGIFELPAVFISLGLGLRLGMFLFVKDSWNYLKKSFVNSVRVFVFIIFPLLIIAAAIEALLIAFFA